MTLQKCSYARLSSIWCYRSTTEGGNTTRNRKRTRIGWGRLHCRRSLLNESQSGRLGDHLRGTARILATGNQGRKGSLQTMNNRRKHSCKRNHIETDVYLIPYQYNALLISRDYWFSVATITQEAYPGRRVILSCGSDCDAVCLIPSAYEDSYYG